MDGDCIHCYVCDKVWPKGDGLECPVCHSDFTEIVEIPPESPEPRPSRLADSPRPNPWGDNSAWEEEDNGAASGLFGPFGPPPQSSSFRTYSSPDGRFQFSSATLNTRSSGQQHANGNPMMPLLMSNINSIFQNLSEPSGRPHRGPPGLGENPFLSSTDPDWLNDDHLTGHHPGNMSPHTGSSRSRNNPRPLDDVLRAAQAELGTMHPTRGPPTPLSMLSVILNLSHPRSADAAYSQEEFDHLITRLMENNGDTGTAAPPATETAIRSLPRKKVDKEMMGTEGNAECSICMDNVELGTEVTVLPCTHWFHYDCIEAWLKQHNTCPHCRRSIHANVGSGDGSCENPLVIQDSPEQPSRRRLSSARTSRSGRSSSSVQNQTSPHLTPHRSPDQEARESGQRRTSRGEGSRVPSWFANRFSSSS